MQKNSKKFLQDHIFGDLNQPKNSAKWLIERYRGIRHYSRKSPISPIPGESVNLLASTSVDLPVDSVHLWMTIDDWNTKIEGAFVPRATTWDTALWSYLQEWEFSLPPQPAGTMLRYKISAKLQGSQTKVFADTQSKAFKLGTHFSIWYTDQTVPDWVDKAIIYQIFIDRFNPGMGNSWKEHVDLKKTFGGTLQGIIEKLPYIHSMGFNALWLTPIFDSPSHHGYDIRDYYHINPELGTLKDFQMLVDVAHQYQIKVILDFVANHCSSEHPYFKAALKDQDNPHHDYFIWKDWPNYECFYNVRKMPKLDLGYGQPARQYLLDVAQYWLKLGVDGFRLDHAHGPEQDFWIDFRRACTQVKSDHWTFAEIVQPAEVQAAYADRVGGSLDFLLCQAIRITFGRRNWPLSKFASWLQYHFEYFPDNFLLPSFIDNHDMNRFMVIAQGDIRLLKLALLVLYMLPGPPIIYYGTEIPLSQNRSIHENGAQGFDEARLPMAWEENPKLKFVEYLAKLAEIRTLYPVLYQTDWRVYHCDDQMEVLILEKKNIKGIFLLINRSKKENQIPLEIKPQADYINLVSGEIIQPAEEKLTINLAPCTGVLISRYPS